MSAIRTKLLESLKQMVATMENVAKSHPHESWLGSEYDRAKETVAEAEEPRSLKAQRFFEEAKTQQRDGELEIDADAVVSISEDSGAYVEAWVWVDDADIANHILYDCEICGCFHPWEYNGDCRDDNNRYSNPEEFEEKHGLADGRVEVRSMAERVAADLPEENCRRVK